MNDAVKSVDLLCSVCFLAGLFGEIVVLKSGKTKLILGDVVLNVSRNLSNSLVSFSRFFRVNQKLSSKLELLSI